MKLINKIRNLFSREVGEVVPEGDNRTGATPLFLDSSGSDLSVATVYSCVKLLSDSVASMPLRHMVKRGGIYRESDDDVNYLLTVEPDPGMGSFDMMAQIVKNLLLDGNAYIVPVYNEVLENLDRLVLCSRGTVSHDTLNDMYSVSDSIMGVYGTYSEDEIIHIKYMPGRDPKRGVSVLTYARMTSEIIKAGDKETRKRFVSGGNPKGVITNDKTSRGPMGLYDNGQIKKLTIDVEEEFAKGRNIVHIPDLVDFKQFSMSSADLEFLASRKFEVREICRFFRVPPSFIFDDSSNNYKSAEQANVAFMTLTLGPLLNNIENEFTRKLIYRGRFGKEVIRFDRRGIYACDLQTKADYEQKLLGMGYTINELRQINNMEPVKGGDVPMCSANLRRVDEIVNSQKSSQDGSNEQNVNKNGEEDEGDEA